MTFHPDSTCLGPEVQADESESDQENPVDEQTGLVGAHSMGSPAGNESKLKTQADPKYHRFECI